MTNILIWTLLAAAGSLVGGLAVVWWNKGSQTRRTAWSGFSAGLLGVVAAAGMIPHALAESSLAAVWVAGGVIIAGALNRSAFRQSENGSLSAAAVWTALAGMGVHGAFEGMALGGGIHVGAGAAVSAAAGLFVHKLPEGAAAASLAAAGSGGRGAALAAAAIPGIGVMLGAVLTAAIMPSPAWHDRLSPFLLALAAGILLRIAVSEWRSTTGRPVRSRVMPFFLGAAAGLALLCLGTWLQEGHAAGSGPHADDSVSRHARHLAAPVPVPENAPVPKVELQVMPDGKGGWNLKLETRNFRFVPENPHKEPLFGEGHAHLYIDGKKAARLFGPTHRMGKLSPGEHRVRVELVDSTHAPYTYRGKRIGDEQVITVK